MDEIVTPIDINTILETIPHRYPFLLIDRIVDFVPAKSIVALKNVTINEPFFQGHFPNKPIMPGVLILEAMAQSLAILALKTLEVENKLTGKEIFFFAGVDNARFKRPIMPGDQMIIDSQLIKYRRIQDEGSVLKAHSVVKVDGKLACKADILALNPNG